MPIYGNEPEILISVDGEFTGPIPGSYSMIALGAVAYSTEGRRLGRFRKNLTELPGSMRDAVTMAWWAKHPKAWEDATRDPEDYVRVMKQFGGWVNDFEGRPKLIGWPLPVDFMFIYWYYVNFVGQIPSFGYDGIDIKSVAMMKFGRQKLADVSREDVQRRVGLPAGKFSHDPVDDAERQGALYFALRKYAPK